MNIKEYIASGILELYVSGLLSDEENLEVDRLADQYPEISKEIIDIREALNKYATACCKGAVPGLEESILEKIRKEKKKESEIEKKKGTRAWSRPFFRLPIRMADF